MTARNMHHHGFGRPRYIVTFIAALSVLTFPVAASSVDTLAVQGNRRVDAETVRSYFHADARGHYDAAALDTGLKALVATGLFEDVRIDHSDGRIVVQLSEAKVDRKSVV